jgi:hypothetical protein
MVSVRPERPERETADTGGGGRVDGGRGVSVWLLFRGYVYVYVRVCLRALFLCPVFWFERATPYSAQHGVVAVVVHRTYEYEYEYARSIPGRERGQTGGSASANPRSV